MVDKTHSSLGSPSIVPGAVVANRYRLREIIGQGAMAEVWASEEIATGNQVAVKVLRAQVAKSSEAIARLRREGELLSSLSHPGIVKVFAYGAVNDEVVYVAMERLHGETLGARMKRGPMTPEELKPIVAATASALAAAHSRGVVHRDLKPENVFLNADQTPGPVKVLDFGISKAYGSQALTYTGELLGTPRYMSPEQLAADKDVDARVDVYAMGVMLYEAISGRPPFSGSNPTELIVAILNAKVTPLRSWVPEVSPDLEAVISRGMARAREARYESIEAFAAAFGDVVVGHVEPPVRRDPSMRTRAMGSGHDVSSSQSQRLDPTPKRLDLGTFSGTRSELGPEGPMAAASSAKETPRTRFAPFESAESREWNRPGEPKVEPTFEHFAQSASAPPGMSWSSGLVLALAGLVLGGGSAGAMIFALSHWTSPEVRPPSATALEEEGEEGSEPLGSLPLGEDIPRGSELALEDQGTEGPEHLDGGHFPPVTEGSAERTDAHRRSSRERRGSDEVERTRDSVSASGEASRIERSTVGTSRSEADECSRILERDIAAGATPFALRRRAECLMRAGRVDEAVANYRRFCRLAPDHPAVGFVRQELERMGLECP